MIDKTDIVEYIGNLISLSEPLGTAGREYHMASCPFHDDSSPSFAVYPNVQRWVCFGCAPEGGDVITFAMKYFGISFEDAKKLVTTEVSPDQAAKRLVASGVNTRTQVDELLLARRLNRLLKKMGFADARPIMQRVDDLRQHGLGVLAARYLNSFGV